MTPSQTGAQEAKEPDAFERDLLKYRSFFDYGGFEPDLETLLPKGYVSWWDLSASVDGTYTTNVDQDNESDDAFWSNGTVGVGWFRQSPRLRGSAEYRLRTTLYQTSAADRGDLSHRAAGTLSWRAAEYLTISGGGHVAQDLEEGLGSTLTGVRSTYENRRDEYGAHAEYNWSGTRNVSNQGSYEFFYTKFASEDADGTDTRRHRARENLGYQVSSRDRLSLGYSYWLEDEVDSSDDRQNHRGNASWGHTFLTFPGNRRSTLSLSYNVERVLFSRDDRDRDDGVEDEDDYWDHVWSVGYNFSLSPRTNAGVSGGYQWIKPDDGDDERSWNAGANIAHQFSENTQGSASASRRVVYSPDEDEARTAWSVEGALDHRFSDYTTGNVLIAQRWEYRPSTTTSDTTELTQTREAVGSLQTRLSTNVTADFRIGYLWGDPKESLGETEGDEYWQAYGAASLTAQLGEDEFLGTSYRILRRQTDNSDEDYLLHRATAFYRRALLDWLYSTLRYSYERRDYDSSSDEEGYQEHRIFGALTASWRLL